MSTSNATLSSLTSTSKCIALPVLLLHICSQFGLCAIAKVPGTLANYLLLGATSTSVLGLNIHFGYEPVRFFAQSLRPRDVIVLPPSSAAL